MVLVVENAPTRGGGMNIRKLLFVLCASSLFSGSNAYKTVSNGKELLEYLLAVPNSMVLFYDSFTGDKKAMMSRLEQNYVDVNIRFVLANVGGSEHADLRALAQELGIQQFPSFGIFKGEQLAKVVRGNPRESDLQEQINKQLVRDPENWALFSDESYFLCNWREKQSKLSKMMPNRCEQPKGTFREGPTAAQALLGTITEYGKTFTDQFGEMLPGQLGGSAGVPGGGEAMGQLSGIIPEQFSQVGGAAPLQGVLPQNMSIPNMPSMPNMPNMPSMPNMPAMPNIPMGAGQMVPCIGSQCGPR